MGANTRKWRCAVERAELTELHYICHVDNLPSILANGILSHRRAQRHQPTRIANEDVQGRRASRTVPGGHPLHDYVNLYLNARNPMLYRVTDGGSDVEHLCVLSISSQVLDHDDVVLTDGNAASGPTAFRSVSSGLAAIERQRVFAQNWNHADPLKKREHKRVMCAEILVPSSVDAAMISGVYVASDQIAVSISANVANVRAIVRENLFFR